MTSMTYVFLLGSRRRAAVWCSSFIASIARKYLVGLRVSHPQLHLSHPRRVAFILECLRVYEGYRYLFNYGELLMT